MQAQHLPHAAHAPPVPMPPHPPGLPGAPALPPSSSAGLLGLGNSLSASHIAALKGEEKGGFVTKGVHFHVIIPQLAIISYQTPPGILRCESNTKFTSCVTVYM